MFLSNEQTLDIALGQRIRDVSRRVLAQVRLHCAGISLRSRRECLFAVLEDSVRSQLLAILNAWLRLHDQAPASHEEFMCYVAMFSIKTAKQMSFTEVEDLVRARDGRAVESLLSHARFKQLKRALRIQMPQLDGANTSHKVRVWCMHASRVHCGTQRWHRRPAFTSTANVG